MNGRIALAVLLVIVLIAGAVGLALTAYQYGVAQGLSDTGKVVAPSAGMGSYPYYSGRYMFHPMGWGFGFLGFLFPLFFFLLIMGLVRTLFWGRHWGHHFNHWDNGVPPPFEEWHRKAHETQAK